MAARQGRESIAGQTSGESEQAAYTRTFPSHSSPPKGTLTAACKLSTHLATPKHQELRGRWDYTKAKRKAACPSQTGASPLCCGTAPGPSVASRRWLGVRRRGQMATQALALSSCLIGTCCQTGPPSPCRHSHSKCRAWRWQLPLRCEMVVAPATTRGLSSCISPSPAGHPQHPVRQPSHTLSTSGWPPSAHIHS